MARQVNFFLLPEDASEIEQLIRSYAPVRILRRNTKNAKFVEANTLVFDTQKQPELFFALAREPDLRLISNREVTLGERYVVDTLRSPVVEFTSCFFDDAILRRGRMYFTSGYYDENGEWVTKDEMFVSWATKLLSKVRRKLVKPEGDVFYYGKATNMWHRNGGKCSQL